MGETDPLGPVTRRRVLSILPTFSCNAACTDCATLSSPRERTSLTLDDIQRAIDQANGRYDLVVFTGGEATLAGDVLLKSLTYCQERRLPTRLVTNAWWARDQSSAMRRMHTFVEAGLNQINFSTGDEHIRFVPLRRVLNAARAAAAYDLPAVIAVESRRDRVVTRADIEADPAFIEIFKTYPGASVTVVESPWMPLAGDEVRAYPDGATADRTNVDARTGCDNILSTTTIQSDGTIGACCGIGLRLIPELHLGSVRDTSIREAEEAAEADFLKRWIRAEGPERILAWASGHNPSIDWEGRYAHRCQACLRLYTDADVRAEIRTHYREKVLDVVFSEWLLQGSITPPTAV